MTSRSLLPLLAASLLTSSALFLAAGCQSQAPLGKSPAVQQGTAAADSIQAAADSITAARNQLKTTLAALRNLTERPGDIPARYAVLREQLTALRASSNKISSAADTMRAKGDAYLTDWARQVAAISDESLRASSLDRRAETAAKLQEIYTGFQQAKTEFAALETSLRDIERALAADLSAKGLEAVRPFVTKATTDSYPLTDTLTELAADFRAVGLTLKP
jgi:hypothetical protein